MLVCLDYCREGGREWLGLAWLGLLYLCVTGAVGNLGDFGVNGVLGNVTLSLARHD